MLDLLTGDSAYALEFKRVGSELRQLVIVRRWLGILYFKVCRLFLVYVLRQRRNIWYGEMQCHIIASMT